MNWSQYIIIFLTALSHKTNKTRGLTTSVVTPGVGEPAGHPDNSQNRGSRLNTEDREREKGERLLNEFPLPYKQEVGFFLCLLLSQIIRERYPIGFLPRDLVWSLCLSANSVSVHFMLSVHSDFLSFFLWGYKLPRCPTSSRHISVCFNLPC